MSWHLILKSLHIHLDVSTFLQCIVALQWSSHLYCFVWFFLLSVEPEMWICELHCVSHRQLGVTGGMSCGRFSLIFVVVQWSTEKTRLNLWALSTNQMPPAVTLAILHHAPSVKKAYCITDLDFLFSPSVCGFHFRLHFMYAYILRKKFLKTFFKI